MGLLRYLPLAIALALSTPAPCQITKFSENQVAGSANDLMIVRHIVIAGDNKSIGKKLAEIAKKQHHAELTKAGSKFEDELGWFKKNYPERYERSLGVRSQFNLASDTNSDYTSLPIDMSLKPGCSVVYYPGSSVSNGHAMFSRNYDFPKASYGVLTGQGGDPNARSMTGDPYVIEMHPTKGFASLYTCAYDLLGGAIDGVNSKGVCVALLADDMSKDRSRGTVGFGLSEVDLPRFVLDRAASAMDARKLLKDVPYYCTFTPCHYIIGDATGDSFIFEVAADGKHYIFDGGGKPQIVTNHSIAEYGTSNLPSGNSFDRYKALQKEINAKRKFTPDEVKTNNFCVAVPANVKVAATLWHAVYDLHDRSVIISFCLSRADEAKERRTPYLAFKLAS